MITSIHSRRAVVIIVAVAVVTCAATAFAMLSARDPKVPPAITLPEAYSTALHALGAETNTFYCLSAGAMQFSEPSLHTNPNVPTEWSFMFYSTNGQLREVIVGESGKYIVYKKLPEVW